MRRITRVAALAVLVGIGAAVAHAQPASSQVAETLFRQGKTLMGQGKIAEACEAFAGSYRKDPSISTLLNLGDCREKNGQYASAWGHFTEALRQTRTNPSQASLFNTAQARSAALEGRLSHLVIDVPAEARVDGLVITRNGIEVDPAEWGSEIPVDGGDYQIEGKAPGHEAWTSKVTVGKERDTQKVVVVKLVPLPEGAGGDVSGGAAGPRPSTFTGKRKAAAGVGAAGVVAAVVGTVLYVQARGTYQKAKDAQTNDARISLTDDANGQYLTAQIAWGVGAAAIGAAAVLWVTGGPPDTESPAPVTFSPHVGRGSAGFVLGGRF